jgi:peptide-methionine (S)-S-oxide reductase
VNGERSDETLCLVYTLSGSEEIIASRLNRKHAAKLRLSFSRAGLTGGNHMQEIATFGAGCFWGIEAAFRRVPGVLDATVGYSGGRTENPSYQDVCTDTTGHAEVVQVTFDPEKLSYDQLLNVFWTIHDPTQVNRQGPDYGKQYRTAIFFHSPEQEAAAKKSKQALEASGKLRRPVATEITPAGPFWRAEEYHQRYLEKRGAASCHI